MAALGAVLTIFFNVSAVSPWLLPASAMGGAAFGVLLVRRGPRRPGPRVTSCWRGDPQHGRLGWSRLGPQPRPSPGRPPRSPPGSWDRWPTAAFSTCALPCRSCSPAPWSCWRPARASTRPDPGRDRRTRPRRFPRGHPGPHRRWRGPRLRGGGGRDRCDRLRRADCAPPRAQAVGQPAEPPACSERPGGCGAAAGGRYPGSPHAEAEEVHVGVAMAVLGAPCSPPAGLYEILRARPARTPGGWKSLRPARLEARLRRRRATPAPKATATAIFKGQWRRSTLGYGAELRAKTPAFEQLTVRSRCSGAACSTTPGGSTYPVPGDRWRGCPAVMRRRGQRRPAVCRPDAQDGRRCGAAADDNAAPAPCNPPPQAPVGHAASSAKKTPRPPSSSARRSKPGYRPPATALQML